MYVVRKSKAIALAVAQMTSSSAANEPGSTTQAAASVAIEQPGDGSATLHVMAHSKTAALGKTRELPPSAANEPETALQAVDLVAIGQPANPIAQQPEANAPVLKNTRVFRQLISHGRLHWHWFVFGSLAAVAVVAARLALPWPLSAVSDRLAAQTPIANSGLPDFVLRVVDPVLALGGIFFLLIFALGLADFLVRLCFARFSIATAKGVRNAAFESAFGTQRKEDAGDLVSRLVGDAAQIKGGLQSFFVHVATSGLLFIGMTLVLLMMEVKLGLIFACAGLATVGVTLWAAARIFRSSFTRRDNEGRLTTQIHTALETRIGDGVLITLKGKESSSEASQTRDQGIASWTTHAIFGAAVVAALYVGSSAVKAGTMAGGDMVIFMMYALMMRGPIVRLARQGAKTGKIFGATHRLVQLTTK